MATIGVAGRRIPARVYLDALRRAFDEPAAVFRASLRGIGEATGADIRRQYRADLHSRINRRGMIEVPRGRVHPATWSVARTPRVVLGEYDFQCLNRTARRWLRSRLLRAD